MNSAYSYRYITTELPFFQYEIWGNRENVVAFAWLQVPICVCGCYEAKNIDFLCK